MAVVIIKLERCLTGHGSVLWNQVNTPIGTVEPIWGVEQFLVKDWSEAESGMDVTVRVFQNEILGLHGADMKHVLFDAIRPCGRSYSLRVPGAKEQHRNNKEQSDHAGGLPPAIRGF